MGPPQKLRPAPSPSWCTAPTPWPATVPSWWSWRGLLQEPQRGAACACTFLYLLSAVQVCCVLWVSMSRSSMGTTFNVSAGAPRVCTFPRGGNSTSGCNFARTVHGSTALSRFHVSRFTGSRSWVHGSRVTVPRFKRHGGTAMLLCLLHVSRLPVSQASWFLI